MSILSGVGAALNTSSINFASMFALTPVDHSPTETHLGPGSGTLDVTGVDLGYDADGHLISGTVTGFSAYTFNGDLRFTFSGLSLDAAKIHGWVAASDEYSFSHAVLDGDDTITGTSFDDNLLGMSGNDILVGGAGADVIFGGDGNDHLYGQSATGGPDGVDRLIGDAGMDYLQGNAGNDILDGGAGADRINGGADDDSILGGDGNDVVNGNMGNDTVEGGSGNDLLRGGQGNDRIEGGFGSDTIMGDKGDDNIEGGSGSDVSTGGEGADTFMLYISGDATFPPSFTAQGGHEIITDFTPGVDHIVLLNDPPILYTLTPTGNFDTAEAEAQALFNGLSGLDNVAVAQVGSDTYLFWASQNPKFVDGTVELENVHAGDVLARDFVRIQDVM